jgi:hypothetical protein
VVRTTRSVEVRCEEDPGRLGPDLKLNFAYVVEDINTHLLQKESPHLVG